MTAADDSPTREIGCPEGLLVDFGGVLTSSVTLAFERASTQLCGDPRALARLLRDDAEAARLLVDHECGRLGEEEFDAMMAERFAARGVRVQRHGLVALVQQWLAPDAAMLAAVVAVRRAGTPVALVTNSLGDDAYRGYDLTALADTVVISAQVGVRKPSRRIYLIACERLGLDPEQVVLVDDLQMNLDGASRVGIRGHLHRDSSETVAAMGAWFGQGHTSGVASPSSPSSVRAHER